MKIWMRSLVPKDWIIKDRHNNCIEVNYTIKGSHRFEPKPVQFPKIIEVDAQFVEGLALYLGDGSFKKKRKHASFVSKDKDIMLHEWLFFKNKFGIGPKEVSCYISFRANNPNIKKDWASFLGLPENKFSIRHSTRHKHEAMQLQINRSAFIRIFELVRNKILESNFLESKELRLAFLRGLFAAEGSIGIATTDSPKPYINFISYHISFYEDKLASLIKKALELENIKFSVTRREKDHSIVIRMTGWDNYWKLWRAKIFDLCERKKTKFLKVAKDLEINCTFPEKFREKLFAKTRFSQKELAKYLTSWQSNVSKMLKGELSISLDRLLILSKLNGINLEHIKENIQQTTVGSLTRINDKGFIELVFDLKTNPTNLYS